MPLYWVMLLYCAAFYFSIGHKQYPDVFLQDVFALQTWGSDLLAAQSRYNGPGWSIGVGLFFYALFPLLLPVIAGLARRWRTQGLLIVVGVCMVVSFALWALFVLKGWAALPAEDGRSAHRWLYRNPLPALVEFVIGLCLGHILPFARRWPSSVHHWVQGTAVLFALLASALRPESSATMAAGSFGALFVVPFTLGLLSLGTERGWLARFLATGPLVALGAASYALYLTHRWLIWQLTTGTRSRSPRVWPGTSPCS